MKICIYCRKENNNGQSVCDVCNKKIEDKRRKDFDESELGQLFELEFKRCDDMLSKLKA